MVNPRDVAGNAEEDKEEEVMALSLGVCIKSVDLGIDPTCH